MSKYSKHMKDKAWRKQNRLLNRQQSTVLKSTDPDSRSTRKTFDQWCEECGDQLGEISGVLSIAGSDGIRLTDTKVGRQSSATRRMWIPSWRGTDTMRRQM